MTPKYIGTPVSKSRKTLGTRQSMFDSLRSRRRKGYGVGDREEGKKGREIGERGRRRLL